MVGEFILQASRDATTDFPITQPQFDWMSEDMLKYTRIMLLSFLTSFGGYSLAKWGVPGFPWFISDWGVFTAIGTEFLLTYAHFRDFDVYYDNLVKAIYEMVFPLQAFCTSLYWGVYYTPGTWDPSNWDTYVYPIFMHIVPLLTFTVESIFNSIVFDIQKGAWRSLWLILAYLPLSYFAKDIVGYLPYPTIVDWASWKSNGWVAAVIALNQAFFYGIAYLNNYLKTGSGVSPKHFFKYHVDSFKDLTKLAKF